MIQGRGCERLYPDISYIMEGDTPSYLYLIDTGTTPLTRYQRIIVTVNP
jgi:hypothetical protein